MKDMSILVVDDSEDGRRLLVQTLLQSGYSEVMSATSAEDAFELLGLEGDSFDANARNVDLILMDIIMPGVNGIDACKRIKSSPAYADVPVVMVTASGEVDVLERAFLAGASDYITKPLRSPELLARVASVLALKEEIDKRKIKELELLRKNDELEKAFKEIKVLQGLIPICSYCKKIRDDAGLWQQMETYIMKHSDASFTHGVCEPCAKKYFPADDEPE